MRYNRLTYLEDAGANKWKKALWRLRCDCGTITVAVAAQVRSGRTQSCGCLQRAYRAKGNKRHGLRKHPLYATWCNMKARCDNRNNPQYKDYGGRGISYHPSWAQFPNFLRDVGEKPFPEATLDRIDNNGNYSPGNVRWADKTTQRRNSRQIREVSIGEETRLLTDWCAQFGISIASVHSRMKRGMSVEEALSMPKAKRFR